MRINRFSIKKGRPVSRVLYLAVSIIYLLRGSLRSSSDLPPDIGRANLSASVHGLATREVYGYPDHPGYRWALTSPFHPYCFRSGYFLLRYSTLANGFPLGNMVLYVARTFLSPSRDSDRTACLYILDLMILDFRFQPHKAYALTTPSNSPLHRGRTHHNVTL